jgi:hypothetical protein
VSRGAQTFCRSGPYRPSLWQSPRALLRQWWLVVPLLGLVELGLQLYFAGRAPEPPAWQTLRPVLDELAADHPLIVVAPEWAEPNARHALGDELMPLAHVARPDESGFAQALEVSILGADAPVLEGWTLRAERQQGPFRLRRYENPDFEPVRFDFVAQLEAGAARVSTASPRGPKPCPFTTKARVSNGDLHGHPTFPARRFACPDGGEWFFVGATVIEDEGYRPRRCAWAHASEQGPLTLRFEDVPLGARITGHAGLPYWFERELHGTPIELTFSVDGEALGTWLHRDGEGWKPFEFSTAARAGQRGTVELQITSERAWRRELCFEASVR